MSNPRDPQSYSFFSAGPVRIIAHRGGCRNGPENSLQAIERSFKTGADVCEIDVRLTRDKVPALCHDSHLRRLTGLPSRIEHLNSGDLHTINLSNRWRYNRSTSDQKHCIIPTLKQALLAFPHHRFSLDIKTSNLRDLQYILEVIEAAKARNRVMIASFHNNIIRAVRRHWEDVPTQASRREVIWMYLQSWANKPIPQNLPFCSLAVPRFQWGIPVLIPQFINNIHSRNLFLSVWTINSPHRMRQLFQSGVNAVITDDPALLASTPMTANASSTEATQKT